MTWIRGGAPAWGAVAMGGPFRWPSCPEAVLAHRYAHTLKRSGPQACLRPDRCQEPRSGLLGPGKSRRRPGRLGPDRSRPGLLGRDRSWSRLKLLGSTVRDAGSCWTHVAERAMRLPGLSFLLLSLSIPGISMSPVASRGCRERR